MLSSAFAFFSVLPGLAYSLWGRDEKDLRLMALCGFLVVIGASVAVWFRLKGGWHSGLETALWSATAAVAFLFTLAMASGGEVVRLAVLAFPYLTLTALLAWLLPEDLRDPLLRLGQGAKGTGLYVHIISSVMAYAAMTMAAFAGLTCLLRERALKAQASQGLTAFSRILPSVSAAERMETLFLSLAVAILLLSLLSGMVAEYAAHGLPLTLTHKNVFSLAAFAAAAFLLTLRLSRGARGRRAARWALAAWLFLFLAWPGVKFVRYVVIGGA